MKKETRRERVAPLPAVLQAGGRHYFFFDLAFALGLAAVFFFAGAFFLTGKSLTSFQLLGDASGRLRFLTQLA
jgi:hypothetical protein